MKKKTEVCSGTAGHRCPVQTVDNTEYDQFLARIGQRFINNLTTGSFMVFTTDAENLWHRYLQGFSDPVERQYHNCNACRHFIERFGSLVIITPDGNTVPALWSVLDATGRYFEAIANLSQAVSRAKVTGVFFSSASSWGEFATGPWHHLSLAPPLGIIHTEIVRTADQKMAEKKEEFRMLSEALAGIRQKHVETALTLLQSDVLFRGEKVLGPATWLNDLMLRLKGCGRRSRHNLLWLAVAQAPAGFCHINGSMLGTLLEDIAAGKPLKQVERSFREKMDPIRYQRPQAAPAAGTVKQAEALFEKLKADGALHRRSALLDEVKCLWRPLAHNRQSYAETSSGIFGHLKTKAGSSEAVLDLPRQTITLTRFVRDILPQADRIFIMAPESGNYAALTTAAYPSAPPILQWDREKKRNPFAWYQHYPIGKAVSWGLPANGGWCSLSGIGLIPSMWQEGFEHHGKRVIFFIQGAGDHRSPSLCLFPEFLKAEFHGIRAVLEAYSKTASLTKKSGEQAAGLMWQEKCPNVFLKVLSARNTSREYEIELWE